MTVSIVLPCYNPAEGWEQNIVSNYNALAAHFNVPTELIIVFDGVTKTVTDSQVEFLKQHIQGINIIRYTENRGKGYAIRQGVAVASGELIIYTDVDFPYSAKSMQDVFNALRSNECDVAVGVKNNDYYANVPFVRRLISRYLQGLIRSFLSMPITDTQCGLKGFKHSVVPLFLQTTIDRYLFDLEFIRNCFRSKKFKVKAIPVALNENVHFRTMNYRILLPEMINFARLIFKNK
jgi:glycosyltransferase involved in cell wall biosynthesis